MGQFFPDNTHLPKSLGNKKLKPFLKVAFSKDEVKKLLDETGEIINPNGTKDLLSSTE
jgi:hypothetical protein